MESGNKYSTKKEIIPWFIVVTLVIFPKLASP